LGATGVPSGAVFGRPLGVADLRRNALCIGNTLEQALST
jgi:hypothetical protein